MRHAVTHMTDMPQPVQTL